MRGRSDLEPCRPDPDRLLRQIQAQESEGARGRLKIFFGYAPRSGKSSRMFDEGLRRLKRGQDVTVGAIQTKGAEGLQQVIREFEVIPLATIGDRETLDVDAVLKRRPQVCLIDELARDNPPGSRNRHRWEDVQQIRRRGINIVGALNLQHICEQQDVVQRITGRRAADCVPAQFVYSADELVIVDVSENEQPMSQLRESALLFAAEVVEAQLQRYMDRHGIHQSWGTQERILVCITPRSSARAMLESGARASTRFHGHLIALHVKQKDLSRENEEAIKQHLEFARKLGAEVHVIEGADPIATILQFAREQRITQLFIGHTARSSWQFWSPNPVGQLIKGAEGMDVRLFPHGQPA